MALLTYRNDVPPLEVDINMLDNLLRSRIDGEPVDAKYEGVVHLVVSILAATHSGAYQHVVDIEGQAFCKRLEVVAVSDFVMNVADVCRKLEEELKQVSFEPSDASFELFLS